MVPDGYKKVNWTNIMVLHWILNPGLTICEWMGMRVPRVMLYERQSKKPYLSRFTVPCPHCQTQHNGLAWSAQNHTDRKNWFGLYCPSCGGVIPCVLNLTSLLLLIITAPIWIFFWKKWRQSWLEKQPARFASLKLGTVENPFAGRGWLGQALAFAIMLWLINLAILALFGEPITLKAFIPIPPLLGGLLFGLMMRWMMGGKKNNTQDSRG